MIQPHTIFVDIDGTILVQHADSICDIIIDAYNHNSVLLVGVIEKLRQWWEDGHVIILTTARPEGSRYTTIKQLNKLGICYHQLIMGITSGNRYLINNKKQNNTLDAAFAININKNEGLLNVNI